MESMGIGVEMADREEPVQPSRAEGFGAKLVEQLGKGPSFFLPISGSIQAKADNHLALNPARCRVCVCGPSVSSVLSREKVALVRRDRERIDGTAARQLAELEARAVDGEGRYEAALADLTRRIQEEEAQGSSAVRAEEVRARLDRMVSANATLRADLQERERKIEKEEQEIQQETDRLNESLATANRELSAFLAGRGFHNEGEDVQALREAVEDQHSTNAQLERELEQVRGMLEDETEVSFS
ncbi:hypothetical protein FOZ62_023419, partial [Perkinsus olseni]